ncbi:MAG TPA: tRNA-dihydrouridine synthase family protein [Polyangiaceae bacterium]|nr:tRNA-dihydrouridine synthase family protein [Polyangiaceae bacterium]
MPPHALAPMDGVTDHVYRDLMTSRARPGAVGYVVSEFLRVTDRPMSERVIRRSCPEVKRGGVTPSGTPVMLQLLGGQPEPLAETARNAIREGAFGIDLNFGCPAKLVNRHDGGASLLRSLDRLERIVAAVRAAVPAERTVSVKVRLGWESHDEVVAIARAAERGGASYLTVHGRTKLEMYGPPADWDAIGRARRAVSIDVVANGDLNSARSLADCEAASGCTRFMLGRGPMGRPSLVVGDAEDGPLDDEGELRLLADLLLDYVERIRAVWDSEHGELARVKQWLSLARAANPAVRPLFDRVKRLADATELRAVLAEAAS